MAIIVSVRVLVAVALRDACTRVVVGSACRAVGRKWSIAATDALIVAVQTVIIGISVHEGVRLGTIQAFRAA